MILPIRKEGDPILRTPAEKVIEFDFALQALIEDMIETMRATGVGLAAPQIGVNKRIFVAEFAPPADKAEDEESSVMEPFPLTILCNPEIIESSEQSQTAVEGCLSVPNREFMVKRPKKVTVKGQDRYGKSIVIEADDFYARALQHEIDHLNGTLITDHIQKVKVIFIGTGSLGAPTLAALAREAQYEILAVVTGDARAKVRGHEQENNVVLEMAKKYKLPVIRTEKVRDDAIIHKIKKMRPDVGIMADFGQIIPESLINIPKHGIINIHPSLLPKYRGPAPIQAPILNGDKETGVTLMLTAPELDAGDIISQIIVELSGAETATILKDYLADVAANHLLNILPYYLVGELKPHSQDHKKATFTQMFSKSDGLVDLNTPADVIERKIRAFDKWPKVYIELKGKRVQLCAAHFDEQNKLVIDRVKPEGKKEMGFADFKNGYEVEELTFK